MAAPKQIGYDDYGNPLLDESGAPLFVGEGSGGNPIGSPSTAPIPPPPSTATAIPFYASYTYRIENVTGDNLEFYYQAPNSVYKNVTVFAYSNREVCAIPNTFSYPSGLDVTQLNPCDSPTGGTPSTPGGTTAPVDSMGLVPGTSGPGGTTIPVTATKFNLRIISGNGAGSTQKYVINGKEYSDATNYQFDINDFKNSVEIIPNYNNKLYNLKNRWRIHTQSSGILGIFETQKSTGSESNQFFEKFPTDIIITFNYEPFALPPETNDSVELQLELDGQSDSAIVLLDNGTEYSVKSGYSVINVKLGSNFKLYSVGSNYNITKLLGYEGNGDRDEVVFDLNANSTMPSLTLSYGIKQSVKVFITTKTVQTVQTQPKIVPGISFVSGDKRDYNINSDTGVAFTISKSGGVSKIKASVNNKEYTFSDLGSGGEAIIYLPDSSFPSAGQYRVILVPSNVNGDGNSIEGLVNAFADFWVGVPDIRDIVYPSVLRGPDYTGTNVDFDLSYKTVNADFVRISKEGSSQYIQGPASGTIKLNVQQILDLDNTITSEDEDKISFTLKLVAYNISGLSPVLSREEFITILFDKGDLIIPRPLAMNRIADGFFTQFNTGVFADETSKYLTHLLHLGDGDTKVVTTWVGSDNSLILKLYEPLTTAIQPNQQVWISKLQSNPIVETVTLKNEENEFCPPLKGPNFSLDTSVGIGYKVFDELTASGSYTSNDIVNKYLEGNGIDTSKLNISYASGSVYLFNNFVNFSSAEERVNNFFYKVQLIEDYKDKYTALIADTFTQPYVNLESNLLAEFQNPNSDPFLTTFSSQNNSILITEDFVFDEINWEINQPKGTAQIYEAKKILEKANVLIRGLDGFEKWLYTDLIYSDSLSYPKTTSTNGVTGLTTYVLKPTSDSEVTAWYESLVSLAYEFDKYNANYLVNNIPEFIKEDYDNNDFILFLDMIGQHFDIIWVYIKALSGNKLLEEKQLKGATNNLIYYLLESMGWEGKRAFDSQFLWEYAFGTNKEGYQKYGMPLEDANNQVWRRILNNLPYLLKHKGTARAMKAAMACYGVPQSMLTIMEYGGPQDPTKDGTTKFTFDDRTAAIKLNSGSYNSSVVVPWKSINGSYPQGIEFRIKPDSVQNTRIISSSQFYLDIEQTTGSFATLTFGLGDNIISAGPYFAVTSSGNEYITASIVYVLGPDTVSGSSNFPLSTEYYSNVLINRYPLGGQLSSASLYEVLLKTSDGQRIINSVSMSFVSTKEYWESGSNLTIGKDFDGNLDEFRLWRVPLQPSKLENHTLHPDAINGNSYTASTADLLFRLDFEYPKNRILDPYIKNVAINTTYGENYATASNMYPATIYPYQYTPYDRTVTATVPSLGLNYSNKIRFEEQTLVGNLSHKVRATQKAFDRAPIDSNRLGIFLSPIKELNMDIVKAFGDFNIDNYIGDPSDDYKDNYTELANLRNYYFQRLDRNIYEYIQLVRYIDKSLFDVLEDLAPARAKVSKGLLIEPHYLERSKTRWSKPESERGDYETLINTFEDKKIELTYDSKDALIDASTQVNLEGDTPNYDTIINAEDVYTLEVTNPNYDTLIDINDNFIIQSEYPTYPPTGSVNIDCNLGSNILAEVDSFTTTIIGLDPNSIANAGFGLYAKNGNSIIRKIEPVFGNFEITGSRSSVFLVKEQYNTKISTQLRGYPTTRSLTIPNEQVYYENVDVTNYRYKVSTLPFSGSISVGNDTVEVVALNGYFPSHYKFVNNLSEGMQRSYFKGSLQTSGSTPDGLSAVETFTTNPNILRVSKTGRGSGEPILVVD
jgi:hypothetical protein